VGQKKNTTVGVREEKFPPKGVCSTNEGKKRTVLFGKQGAENKGLRQILLWK